MALPVEPPVSSPRERKEILSRVFPEKYKVVERPSVPEVPDGVDQLQAVPGEEISLPQPVQDDTGAVIVDTPVPQPANRSRHLSR